MNWLQNSPSLISDTLSSSQVVDDLDSWLHSYQIKSQSLNCSEKTFQDLEVQLNSYKRLGHYAEFLFEYWLSQQAGIKLYDRGVQINDLNGNTVGELDFLLSLNGKPIHLEMAVKFYLLKGDKPRLASFIGPNAKDRFDLKYHKTVSKQSQWLQNESIKNGLGFKSNLPMDILAQEWQSTLLIKGMLFYHWQSDIAQMNMPLEINPSHAKGEWCYQDEWISYSNEHSADSYFLELPRLKWLSAVQNVSKEKAIARSEYHAVVKDRTRPIMISQLKENASNLLDEVGKLIVVPNEWPS